MQWRRTDMPPTNETKLTNDNCSPNTANTNNSPHTNNGHQRICPISKMSPFQFEIIKLINYHILRSLKIFDNIQFYLVLFHFIGYWNNIFYLNSNERTNGEDWLMFCSKTFWCYFDQFVKMLVNFSSVG